MGGQSFGCPFCDRWTFSRGQMKEHLAGAHAIRCKEIAGVGKLRESDLRDVQSLFGPLFRKWEAIDVAQWNLGAVALVETKGDRQRLVFSLGKTIGL